MATVTANPRELAHALLDRLPPAQVAAVAQLLEAMVNQPAAPAEDPLAAMPAEDEPISQHEEAAAAAARVWLETHRPIPNDEILAEFGLASEDWERMSKTPLEPEAPLQ